MTWQARSGSIRLILSDVDGVLTDGGVIFDNRGIETKRFDIKDGLGIKLWQRAGHAFGLVTSRNSHIVQTRAAELGIGIVRQGVEAKLTAAMAIARDLKLEQSEVCYVGDDLPDLPVIAWAGLGVAVSDASEELRAKAHLVLERPGGHGAMRELTEKLLRAQSRWKDLIQVYETS